MLSYKDLFYHLISFLKFGLPVEKHLVKIPYEDMAGRDGLDMVDMDNWFIHLIKILNCLLIGS